MAKKTTPVRAIKPVKKIEYNPGVTYGWQETDVIEITGAELRDLFNNLHTMHTAALNGDDTKLSTHIALQTAVKAIESAFVRAVENGVLHEKKVE